MSNQNLNSISREFALNLAKELKIVNQEIIKEVTKNNDLINQIIKIYNLEEEVSNEEFTNTLSKTPNVAYGHTYHEFDEDGCNDHLCCKCKFEDLEEDGIPCVNCSNIDVQSYSCYYEARQEENYIKQTKSYDSVYEPISHTYLEYHNYNDCIHSVSTCKYCKYRAVKSDQVPCIGCSCIHSDKIICFHVDDEN